MSDENIRLLARKLLDGTASDHEIDTLMDWYAAHGAGEEVLIETAEPDLERQILHRMHERLQARIRPVVTVPFYGRRWVRAAAVIAVLVTGAWLWQWQEHASHPLVEHTVPKKDRQHLTLPDGSEVWINADSRLSYAKGFSSSSREVSLEGEAFFDIKQDPGRPFIVHTAHATTRVLGTAFNVKAYAGELQDAITVLSGKVEVEDTRHNKRQLIPNRQAVVDTRTGELTDKAVAAETYHAWTRGAVEFNGENFAEVARVLNRRFGVNIKFANEALTKCTFIATFEETDSIGKIIALLCKTNGNSYRTDSTTQEIIIDGNSCM